MRHRRFEAEPLDRATGLPRVIATADSYGQRWAACPIHKIGHPLGDVLLDEWQPELLVPWACPSLHSPPAVVAVSPEFWIDSHDHMRSPRTKNAIATIEGAR